MQTIPVSSRSNKHSGAKWYVIRTQPHADHLAIVELEQAGYEIFSPTVTYLHSQTRDVDVPLFPGYIFIHWDLDKRGKPSFHGAPHVAGWVSFDGVAPPVPDEVIAEIADRLSALNSDGGLWRRFKTGEKVRVVSKAMESLAEVVEEARSPQSRVKVLLKFMGRLVPAQVPWETLQPVGDKPEEKLRPPRRTRGRGRWVKGFGPPAVSVT